MPLATYEPYGPNPIQDPLSDKLSLKIADEHKFKLSLPGSTRSSLIENIITPARNRSSRIKLLFQLELSLIPTGTSHSSPAFFSPTKEADYHLSPLGICVTEFQLCLRS